MKIKLLRKFNSVGHALLIALVLCSVLCVSVTGYLTVAEHQNFLSMRSQCWNMAITVVEAGIEEGLEHMNVNITNPGADGWAYDGTWYSHSNTLPSGDSYVVSATVTNPWQPVIVCQAYVTAPKLFNSSKPYAMISPQIFYAAGGVNVSTTNARVSRAVMVHTARGALFTKAMVARLTIDMNGQNVLTDSFDSGSLYKSLYGHYNPSVFTGNNGDVASNDTIVNSINVGNANIYGHIQTGPNGTATIGIPGGGGSHPWQAGNPGTVEPNGTEGQVWYSHDSNFTFPITGLPYDTGLPPGGPATIVTVTYNILSNYVNQSSSYPNPPPWSGVTTNNAGTATVSSYPGAIPGLVTNLQLTTVTCPTYPAAGTYIGSVTTNTSVQSDKTLPSNNC